MDDEDLVQVLGSVIMNVSIHIPFPVQAPSEWKYLCGGGCTSSQPTGAFIFLVLLSLNYFSLFPEVGGAFPIGAERGVE